MLSKLLEKKVAVFVVAFLILVLFFLFGGGSSDLNSENQGVDGDSTKEQVAARIGERITVALVASQEDHEFTNALKLFASSLSQSIDLRLIREGDIANVFSALGSEVDEKLLFIFSPSINPNKRTLSLLEKAQVSSFFFSSLASDLCLENEAGQFVSKYAWNLGIASHSYVESFLSFLNEKYGRVGLDLPMLLYVNKEERLYEHGRLFRSHVGELGFTLSGPVVVDSRLKDLYKTLRDLFRFRSRVFLGLMSDQGREYFYPLASKLGFSFEMAMVDISPGSPEQLLTMGETTKGTIVPISYLESFESQSNVSFVRALKKEGVRPGRQSYQGYLVFKVLDLMLQAKQQKGNINERLQMIDGKTFDGPIGLVTIYPEGRGLIQPMFAAEIKNGSFKMLRALGDMSLAARAVCDNV